MQIDTLTLATDFDAKAPDLVYQVEQRMLALTSRDLTDWRMSGEGAARAAHYHLESGGRRVRTRLALHTGRALDLPEADIIVLAAAVELLHNASLVHDDLQDRDRTRRGLETVWSAFGENIAICTGDLLLSAAYASLATFSIPHVIPKLITLFHHRTSTLIHGQCEDMRMQAVQRDDFATYEMIAIGKSGSLFSLPLELAFVGAGLDSWAPQARQAANSFALGYQILDDIDDVNRDIARTDKSHGLNAVLTLRAAGHGLDAEKIAQTISRKHLSEAAATAQLLPNGAGQLLKDLALGMIRDC
jgi:geranylgeranyl pyrophosphate synthase